MIAAGSIAVVTAMQSFLYEEAGTPEGANVSEITDEVLSGWLVRVLKDEGSGWVRAVTHYGYEGILRAADIRAFSEEERSGRDGLFAVTAPSADLLAVPKVQGNIRETLLRGSFAEVSPEPVVWKGEEKPGWCLAKTAAGNEGFLPRALLKRREDADTFLLEGKRDFLWQRIPTDPGEVRSLRERAAQTALSYLGTQYRWAGKSPAGIDCSGLVFMSWMMSGILVYRDARIEEGWPVRPISRSSLQKGDMIFFKGHVALYLGEGRYVHATGNDRDHCVTINSFDPEARDYREDLDRGVIACGTVFA